MDVKVIELNHIGGRANAAPGKPDDSPRSSESSFAMPLRQEEEDAYLKVIKLNEMGGLGLVSQAGGLPEDCPLRREYDRLLKQCAESNKEYWGRLYSQ